MCTSLQRDFPPTRACLPTWRSPLHFRVHAACRTESRQRTELSKEDEGQWERVSTVNRCEDKVKQELEKAGTKCPHSAPTEADGSSKAKQEPSGPVLAASNSAAAKTESAAGPVVPRGSVLLQQVASSSAAVQTDNNEDVLWDWLTISKLQKHSSSGEESRESIYWNFINDMVFSARWMKSETLVSRCQLAHQHPFSSSYKNVLRS